MNSTSCSITIPQCPVTYAYGPALRPVRDMGSTQLVVGEALQGLFLRTLSSVGELRGNAELGEAP